MAKKKPAPAKRKRATRAAEPEAAVPVPDGLKRGATTALLFLALAAIGFVFLRNAGAWLGGAESAVAVIEPERSSTPSGVTAAPSPEQATARPTATVDPAAARRIGIVSGHRGNDSGTVCDDGLTEASVNFDHAQRVKRLLEAEGYSVDILGEKDERLPGYTAAAFLSIHADSCTYINELATGYKVARSQDSAVPATEDKLVACVSARYRAATGLRFHRNSVTHNMTQYHGFYKINATTPAAIIETGFMALDRDVLTGRADDVARGIADGLVCFLRGQTP
jgi:N-acetylmuramoyl-L-alanine amidase